MIGRRLLCAVGVGVLAVSIPASAEEHIDIGVAQAPAGSVGTFPEGMQVFACNVHPPIGTAPGTYLLTIVQVIGSDQFGNPISMSLNDGFVDVPEMIPGDCDGNGIVTITELIRSVNNALDASLADCVGADLNNDGAVDVSELLRVVNAALNGHAEGEADSAEGPRQSGSTRA